MMNSITHTEDNSIAPRTSYWGETQLFSDTKWRKVGVLALDGRGGRNQCTVGLNENFSLVKLRSQGADVELYQWILQFDDGTIVDLSLTSLLEGTESRPMWIGGRRLRAVGVEYAPPSLKRRGRLEVWAQP